jgi:hypothetical protein
MRRGVGHLVLVAILLSACGVSWGQKKASVIMPENGATDVMFGILQWKAGSTAVFHTVYLGTTPDLGPANIVAQKLPLPQTTYFHLAGVTPGTTYYWRVDETEKDMVTVIAGDVWVFTVQATTAYLPNPADGSNTVSVTPDLKWLPGQGAGTHHVYLSDSKAAVVDGTAPADKGVVIDPNYAPGELLPATAYYWRVDEILADDTVVPGVVWSFTTMLLIEDFESYTDEVTGRIFQAWIDGWGYTEPAPGNSGNGTGATVGYTDAPFAERKTVHAGLQSMPMEYNNVESPFYSEAERTWATAQDWTLNGVDTLTLYVHGQARDFDIPKTTTPPVLDGKIDEAWAKASVQYVSTLVDGQALSGPQDCSGSFRAMYDSGYLYILVDVNDEALVQDSDAAQGWLDDRIEIFIDGNNSKDAAQDTTSDCQYCFRWNHGIVETPVEWYRSPDSLVGVKYGVVTTASGYRHEIQLPWSVMIGGAPQQGQLIGIDVMINDDDNGGDRDSQVAWHGIAHVPSSWGTGRVGEAVANASDGLYVALRDASNHTGVVTYSEPGILTAKTWVEWKIPLGDFANAGVNLAAVRKMFIGVGDRVNPVRGGAGPLYFDDVYLTRPAPAKE